MIAGPEGAAMADKPKLESFKIADTRKPQVAGPKKATAAADNAATQSVGFARIERILDQESPDQIAANMNDILGKLEEFEKKATTPKDKAGAKKAMVAVERAADLMDYLFQTKAALEVTKP